MEEPKEEAVEEPVHSEQDAREANAWVTKELTTLSVISIAGVVLLVVGMMLATGQMDLAPLGLGGLGWMAFVVLVAATAGVFAWSRRGV